MNKVILLGRLGADAELKMLANGNAVLKFSLATSEKYTDKSGAKQEKTQWHRCSLWGDRASKLAPYLVKGTQLAVEGSIEYGSYEKDGVKMYTTDIKALNVEFAGGPKGSATPASNDDEDGLPPAGDGEIPF